MHLGAGRGKRLRSRVGSGETQYLMACVNQLGDESGTDKTCGTSNKDTHDYFSLGLLDHLARAELSLARLEFGVQLFLIKAAMTLRRRLARIQSCRSPGIRESRPPWLTTELSGPGNPDTGDPLFRPARPSYSRGSVCSPRCSDVLWGLPNPFAPSPAP